MSTTTYGVNDTLSNKLWGKSLAAEALKQTYFGKFMGTSSDSMIQIRSETSTNAGDKVTIGLRMQLAGAGVTEYQTLQGNEEALTTYADSVLINELAHAVRVKNKNGIDAQRVPYNLRNEARMGLSDWFSGRFDQTMFNHLCGYTVQTDNRYIGNNTVIAPTASTRIYRTTGSDDATVNGDSTKTMNLQVIDYAVELARVASPMIRPVKVGGRDKYIMFLHDYQVTDLRANTSTGQWLDIQKSALAGGAGKDSLIYSSALGEYNDVILYRSNRVTNGVSNAGAAQANTRRAVLCGAQAGLIAFGKAVADGVHYKWIEEMFDYERELGVSAQTVFGMKKTVFNSVDFGTVVATTYSRG